MPDLIIKPTNTSGNKLILKDQAGGAVLTTADSGATLNNVSITGDVTSSGLLTLSNGINGLRHNQASNTTEGDVLTTSDWISAVSTTITPKSSSSKLLVLANVALFSWTTQTSVKIRVKLTATGHTTSYSFEQGYNSYQTPDTQLISNTLIVYVFTVTNTNEYTLTAEGQKQTGDARFNYDDAGGDSISTITVIEI